MTRNPPRSRSSDDIPSEARPRHITPLRLLLIVAATTFLGEVVVMLLLAALPNMSTAPEALLDGFLITIIVTPALILFLIRPMVLHMDRRDRAEEMLRRLSHTLEDRVIERTAELTAANEQLKREIADRKTAESGLSKSADFIKNVVESAPCILAMYDVNTGACSFISDGVEGLLGYSGDDVLVKGPGFFREVFAGEDLAWFTDANNRFAAGVEEGILQKSCRLRTADGSECRFGVGLVVARRTFQNHPKDILMAAVPTDACPSAGVGSEKPDQS